jgi:CII-binding regulator of phage lambda lysogenization HflD
MSISREKTEYLEAIESLNRELASERETVEVTQKRMIDLQSHVSQLEDEKSKIISNFKVIY